MPVQRQSVEVLEQRKLLSGEWNLVGPLTDENLLATAGQVHALDRPAFEAEAVDGSVSLPLPDGGFEEFTIEQTSLLSPEVAAANPDIATYRGVSTADGRTAVAIDLTSSGLNATVMSADRGMWFVTPLAAEPGTYLSYSLAQATPGTEGPGAPHDHDHDEDDHHDDGDPLGLFGPDADFVQDPVGPTRYELRIAVAANGEWTAATGGTTSTGFNRIVSAVNAADLLYEREFNISFTLVSGQSLVYTDSTTDPYNNSSGAAMLSQNQAVIDAEIGSDNYDIGHVMTRSGGGVASLGVVGQPNSKARGVSGNNPNGSSFLLTFWHEMGHQFSSPHTWNSINNAAFDGQRSASSAYEPGPGSTILSYGGFNFTGDFVNQRDGYFHARTIELITGYMENDIWGSQTGDRVATGNTLPAVDAGPDRVIPASTPFELDDQANDAESLLYNWDQYDLGDDDIIGVDDGNGPLFRSRAPVTESKRVFPEISDILAGRSDADETLPEVSRTSDPLTFRLLGRDGQGGVNWDDVDLTVIDTGAPFAVTSQASPTNWSAGSRQTVTWDVAGTDGNGINAEAVNVSLSTDFGQTWTELVASTPNDGSAAVIVPADAGIAFGARIKVKAVDNVFFAINNAGINITPALPLNVIETDFEFEERQAINFIFDAALQPSGFSFDEISLFNETTGQMIDTSTLVVSETSSGNGVSFARDLGFGQLPDGNYLATLPAASVFGASGESLTEDVSIEFFVLSGDANRDRVVNLADFGILRANFGSSTGSLFSQGDFNYDGDVNLADFGLLRASFGATLAAPSGSLFADDDA